jgi:hypothetical protein
MLRTLALQLILQLLDRIVSRADAALTTESKGESVTPVSQNQRHCCNPLRVFSLRLIFARPTGKHIGCLLPT